MTDSTLSYFPKFREYGFRPFSDAAAAGVQELKSRKDEVETQLKIE